MSTIGPGHPMPGIPGLGSVRRTEKAPRSTPEGLECGDCGEPFGWTDRYEGQCLGGHRWREPHNGGQRG
jgi:hypothetical protein